MEKKEKKEEKIEIIEQLAELKVERINFFNFSEFTLGRLKEIVDCHKKELDDFIIELILPLENRPIGISLMVPDFGLGYIYVLNKGKEYSKLFAEFRLIRRKKKLERIKRKGSKQEFEAEKKEYEIDVEKTLGYLRRDFNCDLRRKKFLLREDKI